MSEALTSPSLFGGELLRDWLAGGAEATALDQWIFWNNSPSRHVPLVTLRKFFPENFFHILEKDRRVRSQVDRVLRSKLSWTADVVWNPQDPLWELSLIAPPRFQRLAFLAAALSMKEALAKIIDGAMVRKLRQEIGEDIMEFVLLSGSLTKYSFETFAASLILPEDPLAALQQRAIFFVSNAFSGKEIGVQQRIASKFPGAFATGFGVISSPLATKAEEILCKLWKEASSWL